MSPFIEVVKIFLLGCIIAILVQIAIDTDTLVTDKTLRVTEVKHIAHIEHYYGDLPVFVGDPVIIEELNKEAIE